MNFKFRKDLGRYPTPPVTLVLKTEDPLLFRSGSAEKYPDVDTEELNELLRRTIDQETRKAHRVAELLDTEEFRKTKERILEDLRVEARELFAEMDECREDREKLVRLNDAFADVMARKRDAEIVFSRWNPWLDHYRKLEWQERMKVLAKGLKGIIVHAAILEETHPTEPGNVGSPHVTEADDQAWGSRGWDRVCISVGANKEENVTKRKEPKLKILSYEPVVFHREMRDRLPAEWLDGKS